MNEQEILQLLGFNPLENQEGFQVQSVPQITQGLLGSTTGEQNQKVKDVVRSGTEAAANMAQVAQAANQIGNGNNGLAARYAVGQQALNQQQQQQAQTGAMLGKIAAMFVPGGSVLSWLKGGL